MSLMRQKPLDMVNGANETPLDTVNVPMCLHAPWGILPAGYSDSGKDAGRMAAAWALYEGQENTTKAGSTLQLEPESTAGGFSS